MINQRMYTEGTHTALFHKEIPLIWRLGWLKGTVNIFGITAAVHDAHGTAQGT